MFRKVEKGFEVGLELLLDGVGSVFTDFLVNLQLNIEIILLLLTFSPCCQQNG